jgi:hypothetical protein
MRVRHALVLCVALAMAGCGGSGSDDDRPPPSATPLASATTTATPTPTPRPTAITEILLGTGRRFAPEGTSETPLVVRYDGGDWTEVAVGTSPGTILKGIIFSTPDVAWAFGLRREGEAPVLLRSADAGRTWVDAAAQLPADVHGIDALAFESPEVGYLVSHRVLDPATFFTTRDGGATWQPLALQAPSSSYGSYAFGVRGRSELVRSEEAGLSVTRLDDFTSVAPFLPSNVFGYYIPGINTVSTAGAREWIAVATQTGPYTRATIVSNVDPERHWPEQRIDFVRSFRASFLVGIDVRDDRNGIAGGAQGGYFEESAPLALVLAADGSWQEASITGLPGRADAWIVVDVSRARGDAAWAVANASRIERVVGSAFLRSDDGGASWRYVSTPFEDDVRLVDLARNTTVR